MNHFRLIAALIPLTLPFTATVQAYPLDGYADTGIARVEYSRLADQGGVVTTSAGNPLKRKAKPAGAKLSTDQVQLRLLDHADMNLPAPDPAFTRQITRLLGGNAGAYGIAVLDTSDLNNIRYAEHRGDHTQNVGSVGKIIVALGFFQALADAYPNDIEARKALLKNTIVTADEFSVSDHHKLRVFDVDTKVITRTIMKIGLQGNLWEYLDWMLSVSSNSSAAMMQREAMLLHKFGTDYPPSDAARIAYFKDTPRKELQADYIATFYDPLTRYGFNLEEIRQGSFFTRTGKKKVPGAGNSYASARSLMEYILRMEQGRLVDEWSSLQIKRLLYMTERRIRYAYAPALHPAAVYFKSGSWYKCDREKDPKCGKYRGNIINYMNSVAIIEDPAGVNRLMYTATLISNVLGKNSANDHAALAAQIHKLIQKAHPKPQPVATGK